MRFLKYLNTNWARPFLTSCLCLLSIVCISRNVTAQTDYYWNGSTNMGGFTTVSNWGTNTNGTGTQPANFAAGQRFNFQNGQLPSLSGAWSVTGIVRLLNGSNFTVSSNPSITSLVLDAGSTFNATGGYTNLGSFTANAASTTVVSTNSNYRTLTYGNFTFQGSDNFGLNGDMTLNGTLRQSGSGEIRLVAASTARTHSVNGLTVDSTRTVNLNNGTAAMVLNNSGNLLNQGTLSKGGAGTTTINFTGSGTSTATWGTVTATNFSTNINANKTVDFLDTFDASSGRTLTVASNGTLRFGNGGAAGAVSGNFTNDGSVVFNRTTDLNYSNSMSGNGSLTKNLNANFTLSGSNSYSGGTTINAGTLTLGHVTDTLANGGAVTVSGGTLAIGNNSDTVGAVTLSSGSITGTGGTLTGSSYTVESGTVSAILGGNGVALTKNTNGSVALNGSNSYTGGTTVNAGTLTLGHGTNTLADSGAVTVSGGTLAIGSNSDSVGAVSLTSGSITGTGGTLTGSSYAVESGSISANLGGAGVVLTKSNSGTVTLSGANSYTGATNISAGTLTVNGSLSDSTSVSVTGTGIYDLGASDTINGISGNGGVTLGNNSLTVGGNGGGGDFSGGISGTGGLIKSGVGTQILSGTNSYGTTTISAGTLQVGNGGTAGTLGSGAVANSGTLVFNRSDAILSVSNVTGTGAIQQAGGAASMTTLNGTNTSGSTTVTSGTLAVNGTLNTSGAFNVANAGTLQGTGTVTAGTVNVDGVLAPGNSIGTMAFTGNVDLTGGTLEIEYDGSLRDLLTVTGNLDLTGASLNLDRISGGAAAPLNQWFVFATYGTLTGTFGNNVLPNPSISPYHFVFDYNYNGLNQIAFSAIPEPTSIALIGVAAVGGGANWLRRRRKNKNAAK